MAKGDVYKQKSGEKWSKYTVVGLINGKLVTEDCATMKEVNATITRLKKQGMSLRAIQTRYDKPPKK